ncbi:MAG: DUF3445 domain-containing protein [Rhizobiaceae bacterium]|nr:DUF3445 domain-containing protein [Rhizobiaceae bacterium]
MTRPVHTPYDGSAKPFSIGLKPIEPGEWIEIDDALPAYLAEKRRLYAERPDAVFVAEPDTVESQQEVLDALTAFLPERYPGIYQHDQAIMRIAGTPEPVVLDGKPDAPLVTASLLVQEDLVLMRRGDDGWRLTAASVCFPSSWTLTEKFTRPLEQIHKPVPGFGPDTRMATVIRRIFDNLQPGHPVARHNWALATDDHLYHPANEVQKTGGTPPDVPRFGSLASTFVRVERQTLTRMPVSGDILFTIRIHVDPMAVLERHADRTSLAAGFADQLAALEPAHLTYKRLTADRDALVARLRAIAAG